MHHGREEEYHERCSSFRHANSDAWEIQVPNYGWMNTNENMVENSALPRLAIYTSS